MASLDPAVRRASARYAGLVSVAGLTPEQRRERTEPARAAVAAALKREALDADPDLANHPDALAAKVAELRRIRAARAGLAAAQARARRRAEQEAQREAEELDTIAGAL